MAGNTTGHFFRLTTFGESHGVGVGGVIDGCPAGLPFDSSLVERIMARRRPGTTAAVSARREDDEVEWLSGIHEGMTTGSPIAFLIRNRDQRSADYASSRDIFRPSHADLSYHLKYGHRDQRGGGRASARETAARVAGGAVAMMLLGHYGMKVRASAIAIGEYSIPYPEWVEMVADEGGNPLNFVEHERWEEVSAYLGSLKAEGDSTGGRVGVVVSGMLPGLGEPVFQKLNAELAAAVMSLPAAKGVEFGSGFRAASARGSMENDPYVTEDDSIRTRANRAGGIQGGISTGEDLVFSVAFKPASSISKKQGSVDSQGRKVDLEIAGRHDPCVVPRAVPVVEAMTALVLADHLLMSRLSRI